MRKDIHVFSIEVAMNENHAAFFEPCVHLPCKGPMGLWITQDDELLPHSHYCPTATIVALAAMLTRSALLTTA